MQATRQLSQVVAYLSHSDNMMAVSFKMATVVHMPISTRMKASMRALPFRLNAFLAPSISLIQTVTTYSSLHTFGGIRWYSITEKLLRDRAFIDLQRKPVREIKFNQ